MRHDRRGDHHGVPRPGLEGAGGGAAAGDERGDGAEDGESDKNINPSEVLGYANIRLLQIADSGLPLHAFDSFEEAAKKVISLARQS